MSSVGGTWDPVEAPGCTDKTIEARYEGWKTAGPMIRVTIYGNYPQDSQQVFLTIDAAKVLAEEILEECRGAK